MVHVTSQIARAFSFTPDKIYLNVWISVGAAAVSGLLCLFILGAAWWIYSKPWARHTIDRVSFRLLLWSMLFELFYDIAFIAVGVESAVPGAPQAACATGVYFMMSNLGTVNYLCTCIALNLMLLVCFRINPIEKKLERWYVGVSFVLGIAVPIVPAALGHFGSDPILNVCWIQAKDDQTRMRYFILDLYLWQILSCVVATLAVIATLISLFRQRRRTLSQSDHPKQSFDTERPPHLADDLTGLTAHLQTKFFKIACLISLYPIALIVVNGFLTVGDLYLSASGGVKTSSVYALYCIYYFLYGGRGIVFALLGIFVDPCLRRGLRAAWKGDRNISVPLAQRDHLRETSLLEILGPAPSLPYYSVPPTANIINDSLDKFSDPDEKDEIPARKGSKASIDLSAALSRLPLEVHVPMLTGNGSPNPSKSRTRKETSPGGGKRPYDGSGFTRSFSGVPIGQLPEGLSDDVDVSRSRGGRDPYLDWTRPALDARGRSGPRTDGEREEEGELEFEPLEPDLPDWEEMRMRRRKAALVEKEEAMRAFEETRAQL